jgi:hypothetical protein
VSWSVVCCASLFGFSFSDLDMYKNHARSFRVFLEAIFSQDGEILMEPAKVDKSAKGVTLVAAFQEARMNFTHFVSTDSALDVTGNQS